MKYNLLFVLLLTTTATRILKGADFFRSYEFVYGNKNYDHPTLSVKTLNKRAEHHVDTANRIYRIPLVLWLAGGTALAFSDNKRIIIPTIGIAALATLRSEKVKNDALTAASKDLGKHNRRGTDDKPTLYLEYGSFSKSTIKEPTK